MKRTEKADPLVSVIICFYNEEAFLAEAIASVLAQSYSNWELILVDDGSTDGSTDIARRYAATGDMKRIIYIEHPQHANKGLSASRNRGISHARGNYIAFLDADDVWLPAKLEKQVQIMTKYPEAALTCGASLYWSSWSAPSKQDVVISLGTKQNALVTPPDLSMDLYPLGTGAAPCPSGIMVTRKAVDEVGGFEEHFRGIYQLYEDQGFLSKVYLQFPVYINAEHFDKYRQRPESIVATAHRDGNYKKVRQYFLLWLKEYLAGKQIKHPGVLACLDKALHPYRSSWVRRKLNRYLKR